MNLGMPEMFFIFLLALILFGPKKLPEIGRTIGRFMAEFKRASNDFNNQLQTEIANVGVEPLLNRVTKQTSSPIQLSPSPTVSAVIAEIDTASAGEASAMQGS